MAPIRRLVIDVLKPHDPGIREFTQRVAETESVDAVSSTLIELDQEVQNVELTVEATEGGGIDYDAVAETVESLGGSVHSVDNVVCGTHVPPDQPRQRRG